MLGVIKMLKVKTKNSLYRFEVKWNYILWFHSYLKLFLVTKLLGKKISKYEIEFVIKIHNVGMFASFNWILYVGLCCEKLQIRNFSISYPDTVYGGSSSPNSNWIDGILIPRNSIRGAKYKIRINISNVRSFPEISRELRELNLIKSNQIFQDLFEIEESILQSVFEYVSQEIASPFLAIHLRGTDKYKEARLVTLSEVLETLSSLIDRTQNEVTPIFVASDEKKLIEDLSLQIERQFPNCKVYFQKGFNRSLDGRPLHLRGYSSSGSEQDLAIEALIEALILSKSSILIRNSSFLSGWASIFNPNLKVLMLNAPDKSKNWFPDSYISLNQFPIDGFINLASISKPKSGL